MSDNDKDYEVVQMFCQRCGKEVFVPNFRTLDSMREFMMTGLCQDCQDKIRLSSLKLMERRLNEQA